MSRAKYDLTEVCRAYQDGTLARQRQDLIKELRQAMGGNPQILRLLASIMESMVEKGHQPMDCLGFTLCQGMALGILLEQEYSKRKMQ
jgi:hypothetical protein